jgi:hypothetical protein
MKSAHFVHHVFTMEALVAAGLSTAKLEDCLKRDGSREQVLKWYRHQLGA